MQENTKEKEYIAIPLCRYGGQSPERKLIQQKKKSHFEVLRLP